MHALKYNTNQFNKKHVSERMKIKHSKILIEWLSFTLIFFFLYDIIWAIADYSDFKSNFDGYFFFLLLDLSYCSVFSLSSLLLNKKLFGLRLFKRAENNRTSLLLCSILVLVFNIIIACLCELIMTIIDPDFEEQDVWGTFFLLSIIASLLSLLYLSLHYSDLIIQKSKDNIVLQKKYLKLQLDPHFVFNSLSSLAGMIAIDSHMAEQYVIKLSHIYRYILKHIDQDLITINEAKDFSSAYVDLLNMRFDNNIVLQMDYCDGNNNEFILSLSIQLLIENAVKHNLPDKDNILYIKLEKQNNSFVIRNNRIYTNGVNNQRSDSYGIGISNLNQRYLLECKEKPKILIEKDYFEVVLPIIRNKTI